MAFVPGNDDVRHLSLSKTLISAPDIYGSEYPWFHFTWAVVNALSTPPMWLFQSGVAYLSIILIFSFYVMAKSYLSDIDKRAHVIATIFFSIFSGFGWFYFIQQKFSLLTPNDYYFMLRKLNNISFWDIGSGQGTWLWLYFRPITIGFIIFFILLYLMKREDLTRRSYIIISSLLALTLSQTHFSELVIFVVLLFVISLVKPTIKLRLMETGISVLISIALSVLVTTSFQLFLSPDYQPYSNNYMIVLAGLSGILCLLAHYHKRPTIPFRLNTTVTISILFSIYVILLFFWFFNADRFSVKYVAQIYAVPWELYPVMLGIVGALAIPGIILVVKKYRNHPIVIFVVLVMLAIVIAKCVTYVNANIIFTGYWERRIIPFIFVASSILAPLAILNIINRNDVTNHLKKSIKNYVTVIFLSLLVLGGTLSTMLTIEYNLLDPPVQSLTTSELKLQSSLDNVDPRTVLLTVSDRSKEIATYQNLGYVVGYFKDQMWPSKSPELTLDILSALDRYSIIFLSPRDINVIQSNYTHGYIASHLLKVAPVLYDMKEGQTLQIPRLVPTSSNSYVMLVVPKNQNETYFGYDILSLGGYNYTTVLLSDLNSISKAKIVFASNDEVALKLMEYKKKYDLQFEKLLVLATGSSGSLVDVNYTSPNARILVEDNSSNGWFASGIGTGTVGIPKLTDAPDVKRSGNSSLVINVGQGKYGLWQISKLFDAPQVFTKYDVAKFNWYGKNDEKWYTVEFISGPGKYFWYKFQDSWNGWRQVVLPLQMSDGNKQIYGILITKITTQGASWDNIKRINVRTEKSTINQKGIFYFNGFALDKTLKSYGIKEVYGKKNISFQTGIDLNQFLLPSNYDTIAYYDRGTPFVLHKTYNNFDMFYLNLIPIVQNLNPGEGNTTSIYSSLGQLLELTDVNLPSAELTKRSIFSLVAGGVCAFTKVTFTGNLTLESSSAIINSNSSSVKITTDGNSSYFNDVSQIVPIHIDNLVAKSDGGVMGGGSGFYSNVLLNRSSIKFKGEPAVLSLIYNNESSYTITGKEIQINLVESNMSVRQPMIISNGVTKFENLSAYGDIGNKLQALDQNLIIEGQVAFDVKYPDVFTITHDTSFKGKVIRYVPLYPFSEFGTFTKIFNLS